MAGLRTFPAALCVALLGAMLAGCSNGSTLIVELRTEMRPGVEFERVETALYAGSGIAALDLPQQVAAPVTLTASTDAYAGTRVAELEGVPIGPHLVRVQLLDARRAVVGTGLAAVTVEGSNQVITVFINRACRGVQCPGSGQPNEIACLGGRCVDPACPADPLACPPPECTLDGDCAGTFDCVVGRCLEGFCVTVTEDARCSSGVCQLENGCSGESDAGPSMDAGGPVDAGRPADAGGVDAGPLDGGRTDAGPVDAGLVDAGPADAGPPPVDAGPPDSGPPPGPPCFELRTSGVSISLPGVNSGSPTWLAPDTTACSMTVSGDTPHYFDFVMCNAAATPRSFDVTILSHPTGPDVPNGSIWGYRGTSVPADTSSCEYVITGIGTTAPSVTLLPGEYFVLRTGGTATGATGDFSMSISP